MIQVPTGIWRAIRNVKGEPIVRQLALSDIMPVDGHSRLLKYDGGILSLDNEPVKIIRGPVNPLDEDDEPSLKAEIAIRPLDRLYLSGCVPGEGVKEHPDEFAAYLVDLKQSPYISCGTDEDNPGILVAIKRSDY